MRCLCAQAWGAFPRRGADARRRTDSEAHDDARQGSLSYHAAPHTQGRQPTMVLALIKKPFVWVWAVITAPLRWQRGGRRRQGSGRGGRQ